MQLGRWAKGSRVYDWAKVEIRPLKDSGKGYWLLARRSLATPGALAYYVCYGPEGATLEELAWVAGTRWTIEECFEEAKGQNLPSRRRGWAWTKPRSGGGMAGTVTSPWRGWRRRTRRVIRHQAMEHGEKGGCYGPNKELIPLTAPGNCSELDVSFLLLARHSGPRIQYGAGFDPESRNLRNQQRSLSLAFLDSREGGNCGWPCRGHV